MKKDIYVCYFLPAYVQTLEFCAFEEASPLENGESEIKLLEEAPPLRRRLIITLSNCHYTVEKIMPRLIETLDKHGYQETSKVSNRPP